MRVFRVQGVVAAAVLVQLLSGCDGAQSALDPAGRGAEEIAALFWSMVAGAAVVWFAMVGLSVYAIFSPREPHTERQGRLLIVGGGVVFPTLTLAALLIHGLAMLPTLVGPAPEGSLRIAVSGEQWWWRVRYLPPDGEPVDLANEIRLPVGEPVEFSLESADVIHSFWIPPLGGKIDMIPGRRNRLVLVPTRTGTFRGVCAEFCGSAHARMAFPVVVSERAEFTRWLAAQRQAARVPVDPLAARGRGLFVADGCGACHTIRGTPSDGVVGPDLTHVGSRLSLAAATLPNRPEDFLRWIGHAGAVKPGALMPPFDMLPAGELRALAAYLESLQ